MKAVIVTWYDAYSLDTWYASNEIKEKLAKQPKGALTYSMGFLFQENNDAIVIAQSWQPGEEEIGEASHAGFLIVPRAMVKEIEVLKD